MREIKFRAWISDNDVFNKKGMYTGFSFDDIEASREEANIWCSDNKVIQEPKWDKLKIMQYTGLKDKNGKEIYEGDIIKTIYERDCDCCKKSHIKTIISEVKFKNSAYYKEAWCGDYNFFQDDEIMGNKFENPELLGDINEK